MINHVKSEAGFPMEGFYNIVFPITCFVQKQVLVLVVSINPLHNLLFLCDYKSEKYVLKNENTPEGFAHTSMMLFIWGIYLENP